MSIYAGNTSIIQPRDETTTNRFKALLAKLGRGASEFPFLGQPNDIAATVQSIKNVPKNRIPQPQVKEVPCNHLVYFTDPDGLQSLAEAVIGTGILTIAIPPSYPAFPASSAAPDISSPMPPPPLTPIPTPVTSEAPNMTPTPSSGATPVAIRPTRPTTPASQGPSMWLIGLIVAILVVAGVGFWLWQQSKDKEPNPQNGASQSIGN